MINLISVISAKARQFIIRIHAIFQLYLNLLSRLHLVPFRIQERNVVTGQAVKSYMPLFYHLLLVNIRCICHQAFRIQLRNPDRTTFRKSILWPGHCHLYAMIFGYKDNMTLRYPITANRIQILFFYFMARLGFIRIFFFVICLFFFCIF